jgi:hypothetical protein
MGINRVSVAGPRSGSDFWGDHEVLTRSPAMIGTSAVTKFASNACVARLTIVTAILTTLAARHKQRGI